MPLASGLPTQEASPGRGSDPTFPFQSADLSSCQGRQYLAYANRLPCVSDLGRSADSSADIKVLRHWFADLGVPKTLTTDSGPHFSSQRFADFCRNWQIHHVTSSPHYRQSNGHAEARVEALKTFVLKTTNYGYLDVDWFQHSLLEWRNTLGPSGSSSARMLFGRPLTLFLFARRSRFSTDWREKFTALAVDPSILPVPITATVRPILYCLSSPALTLICSTRHPNSGGSKVQLCLWDVTAITTFAS